MSNTKHTPGPWEARIGKSAHAAIYVQGTNRDVAIGVRPEDARLIAAAPDLAEVLQDCLGNINPELGYAQELESAIRAALAKAGAL